MSGFEKKGANPETLAQMALKDEKVLQEALDGVLSKKDVIRHNSFQALNFLSEKHPEKLYGKWDFFTDMIRKGNSFHKYIAVRIIANLTKADPENKFEKFVSACIIMGYVCNGGPSNETACLPMLPDDNKNFNCSEF